jgi:uncharacterized membrane protein
MTTVAAPQKIRIQSIDILRGAIMLIMALDHVRDYFQVGALTSDPTNMATTTPALFFTRWITHFCAPTFVFLSGISAYLAGTRRTKKQFSGFLMKRGLWLIVVELLLITLALTLNPLYNVLVLQVIWVIGLSMIFLGLLIWLPKWITVSLAVLLFFGHNILDSMVLPQTGVSSVLLKVFLTARGTVLPFDASHFVFVLYAVLPWTGVMLMGYLFGPLYNANFDAAKRKRLLLTASATAFVLFVVLRYTNIYGDPAPWALQKNSTYTFLSFLNVSKYPPSLMYTCMTLSVSLLVLALTERGKGKVAAFFTTYGNVPFFYYMLHFYLIRLLTVILFFVQGFKTSQIITPNIPFLFAPPGFGYSLGGAYIIWLLVILTLYFPCRWYSQYKKTHSQWWLSYL